MAGLFLSFLQAQSRTGGGRSREDIIMEMVVDQLERLPPAFDLELARFMYPVRYEESMNSVLVQEMVRFNKLTDVRATSPRPLHDVRARSYGCDRNLI